MSGLGLYVHIPWCVRKCPYCDFNSHPIREGGPDETSYVDALVRDFDSQWFDAGRLDTVFFGGGTPSLFSAAAFSRLLEHIGPFLRTGAEITMEANPGTTEHQDLGDYRRAGINRLSFGVQSFNSTHLHALGRIHDVADVYRSYESARRAGFDNINLDLMYGLPQQNRNQALDDLHKAIDLAPEHLSWYQLTIEPKTEFARRPPPLPGDLLLETIETAGYQLLEAAGYQRYEVSAWAQPGCHCHHNRTYWSFGDYLGIGAGAHGKQLRHAATYRTRKAQQPRLYLQDPTATDEALVDPADLPSEFMMNALRLTEGVPPERFTASTGLSLAALEPARTNQVERGLLQSDQIAATPRGYAVLDRLIQDYL